MKSVIHEASSIAKAIEQGWVKAGKPKDFTVKIFEEPQKNFIGFTVKNAKVGIFVEDRQQPRGEFRPKKHAPQQRRGQHRGDWRRQQPRRQDDYDRSRDRRFEGRGDDQRSQQNPERSRDQQPHDNRPHHTPHDDRNNDNTEE